MDEENKFMKILIACGATLEQLKDFKQYIEELEPHKYHCTGYHPVLRRIDIIKENIVIHQNYGKTQHNIRRDQSKPSKIY